MSSRVTIKPQHIYYDKHSTENGVGTKAKYKLAGYPTPLEGVSPKRMFWVLTTQSGSYPSNRTITIEQHHYINKMPQLLNAVKSYACPDHREELSNKEIKAKRQHPSNGFKYSAKLCDEKFIELLDAIKKIRLGPQMTIPEWKKIAASATTSDNVDTILKELHLF